MVHDETDDRVEQIQTFREIGNDPHYWRDHAEHHLRSTRLIIHACYKAHQNSVLPNGNLHRTFSSDFHAFHHTAQQSLGYAIEMSLKGIWFSRGNKMREKTALEADIEFLFDWGSKGHDLNELSRRVGTLVAFDEYTLKALSGAIMDRRYPIPKQTNGKQPRLVVEICLVEAYKLALSIFSELELSCSTNPSDKLKELAFDQGSYIKNLTIRQSLPTPAKAYPVFFDS